MDGPRIRSAFLVERYWPGVTLADVERAATRTRAAGGPVAGVSSVHYLGSVLIPDEETVFSLFDGPDLAAVVEANRRGGFRFDRIRPVKTHTDRRRRP